MNSENLSKKITIGLTTTNLFFWVWAMTALGNKEVSNAQLVGGIALMLAMWIQYRAVLDLREHQKKEEREKQAVIAAILTSTTDGRKTT